MSESIYELDKEFRILHCWGEGWAESNGQLSVTWIYSDGRYVDEIFSLS